MRTWMFLTLALVAVATNLSAEGRQSRREHRARCYAIRVEPADTGDSGSGSFSRHSRSSPVFSAAEVKDLRVEVLLPDEMTGEPVAVKLFTPRGRLYQVLDLAAATPREAEERRGRRRGSRRSHLMLSAEFPVAGTQITSFDLFGEWRAEPYLDSNETPCARPFEFEIQR